MSSIEGFTKTKKALILIAASGLFLFLSLAILEILASYYLKQGALKYYRQSTLWEFILSKPLPFAGTDDYEEVRKEWTGDTDCPKNRIVADTATGFPRYESANVQCNGPVTIRNGLRTTTDLIESAPSRIMFFGGSTMWGVGSADRNTIPSLIQRRLGHNTRMYGVYNYGFTSVVIRQQLRLLKSLPVNKGDIVIFYDGGNDVWNSVVYGNAEGGIIGYNDANYAKIFINRAKFYLSTHSSVYEVLGHLRNKGASSAACIDLSEEVLISRAMKGFEVYQRSIEEAKKYVENGGGHFLHFLQPSLVSSPPLSSYKNQLISQMADETKCGTDAFAKGYSYYRNKYATVKYSINGTDLSSILNSGTPEEEYFWDHMHVSSNGNKAIAAAIFAFLEGKIQRN